MLAHDPLAAELWSGRVIDRAERVSGLACGGLEEQSMSESHRVVAVRGEPLPAGDVGVRVRVVLTSCPTSRWSRLLRARLATDLVGHPAVGFLRLDEIVQGDEIVLDGVEAGEARSLARTLRDAVEATNRACTEEQRPTANVAQAEADAIAHEVALEHVSALIGRSQTASPSGSSPSRWFG